MLMSVKMMATPALITARTLKVLTNAPVLMDTFSMTPHV